MCAFDGGIGVAGRQGVFVAAAEIGAGRYLAGFLVQRQVADAGEHRGVRAAIPHAHLARHHAALCAVLGDVRDIKEGDLVSIFARKGALNLSTKGLAKTDGRLGETIQVKNISSNKVIHCRVDGPGIVSVEF